MHELLSSRTVLVDRNTVRKLVLYSPNNEPINISGYVITENGIIYKETRSGMSDHTHLICRLSLPFTTDDGYTEYVLTKGDGKQIHVQGQRAVAYTYLGIDPNKKYVNHINGIRDDNRVDNLEWITQSENLKHSYRTLGREPWNKKNNS